MSKITVETVNSSIDQIMMNIDSMSNKELADIWVNAKSISGGLHERSEEKKLIAAFMAKIEKFRHKKFKVITNDKLELSSGEPIKIEVDMHEEDRYIYSEE